MAVPNEILDGAPPHGTSTVTINSITYIVNKETITPEWKSAENSTSTGRPNQMVLVKGRYKIVFELQLASSGTAFPPPGAQFFRTPPNESSPITFFVSEVPYEATNEVQIRVANVTALEAIATITTA